MRMRSDLNFGLGVLHLDVLRARIRRRRKLLAIATVAMICLGLLWAIRPLLLGRGVLIVTERPAGAVLTLNGQPLSGPVAQPVSGRHQVQLERPGYYPTAIAVTIIRGQTTTLSLPALRPRPTVQPNSTTGPWRNMADCRPRSRPGLETGGNNGGCPPHTTGRRTFHCGSFCTHANPAASRRSWPNQIRCWKPMQRPMNSSRQTADFGRSGNQCASMVAVSGDS